ncbi:hypothetical protein [Paraburkholderia dipogonis]|uniref:hypothetical protein n=1 Tax=Paraburkholderia dipogonis TaxID=1211383 RepID=UPI0038BD3780
MGNNKQERWVEFSLEQVLKHFAETRITLEEGETLVDHAAYVDLSKGFVAFKLDTYVAPKVTSDHDSTRVRECPSCKRPPRLVTTYLDPRSESHQFECDKCELTTSPVDSIEQATQSWNTVVTNY